MIPNEIGFPKSILPQFFLEKLHKIVLLKLHNCAAVPIVMFDLPITGSNVAFSVFPVFIDSSTPTSSFVPSIQWEEIGADKNRQR